MAAGKTALALALLMGLGLLLRLWGLDWGLPDRYHYNSYHGGESRAVAVGLQLDLRSGDLLPRWRGEPYFRWGSHYIYAAYLANFAAAELGWLDLTPGQEMGDWPVETFARAHLVARAVSALYSAGIVLVVWALARSAYGARVALAAAALVAVSPLLVVQARFATVNSCLAFWTTAAVSLHYRAARRATATAFLAGGLGTGLALAAKLSALPLLAPGGLALLLVLARGAGLRRTLLLGASAILGLGLGFALASPYALIHAREFAHQIATEMRHGSRGHGLVFAGTGNGWSYLVLANLPVGLGWPLWAASAGGVGLAAAALVTAVRRGALRAAQPAALADALVLAWVVGNILSLGAAGTRFLRYLMPLVPFLALLAARFLLAAETSEAPRTRALGRLGWGLVALATLGYSWASVRPFADRDPRDTAREFFHENVPGGTPVGFVKRPCHVTPPIYRNAAGRAGPPPGTPRYRNVMLDADPERLRETRPPWIVLNTVELLDELRLGLAPDGRERTPAELEALGLSPEQIGLVRNGVAFQRELESGWRRVHEWKNDARLFGLSVEWDPPPQGWAAAVQRIEVWRRADLP